MSSGQAADDPGGGRQPTEEELRAAYEAELKKIRVEQIVLEQVVSLINLGMRRTGLGPGTEDERDIGQVGVAIDAVRALLPLVEQTAGPQAAPIRDALSQLQLAFVKLGGASGTGRPEPGPGEPDPGPPQGPGDAASEPASGGPAGTPPPPPEEEPKPGEPGPAQRSGRLWIPGQ
ncbi:MAG TPA: hypothetical protein VGL51_19575 [Solirubrobacteraceae bacterium]|jgi:hypothetical protein